MTWTLPPMLPTPPSRCHTATWKERILKSRDRRDQPLLRHVWDTATNTTQTQITNAERSDPRTETPSVRWHDYTDIAETTCHRRIRYHIIMQLRTATWKTPVFATKQGVQDSSGHKRLRHPQQTTTVEHHAQHDTDMVKWTECSTAWTATTNKHNIHIRRNDKHKSITRGGYHVLPDQRAPPWQDNIITSIIKGDQSTASRNQHKQDIAAQKNLAPGHHKKCCVSSKKYMVILFCSSGNGHS